MLTVDLKTSVLLPCRRA